MYRFVSYCILLYHIVSSCDHSSHDVKKRISCNVWRRERSLFPIKLSGKVKTCNGELIKFQQKELSVPPLTSPRIIFNIVPRPLRVKVNNGSLISPSGRPSLSPLGSAAASPSLPSVSTSVL